MNGSALDDAPLSRFHIKTAVAGSAGQFTDGYILGIIAPVLPLFAAGRDISPAEVGLLGASALIGLFIGATFFGWVTDKIGRRVLFVGNIIAVAVLSLCQLWVDSVAGLFLFRLLIGIAVGADYAVAPALVAEFSPRKHRATLLATMPAIWMVGYVTSFIVGAVMTDGATESTWRWMLISGAIPAALLIFLRVGIPESPRWLAESGRHAEALAIVHRHITRNASLADILPGDETGCKQKSRLLSQPFYRKRLAFVGLFWFCQIVPYYAVFTFLPTILQSLSTGSVFAQTLVVNAFLLLGSLTGVIAINLTGRRTFALVAFSILTLSTAGLGLWAGAPIWFILTCFAFFALVSSALSSLDIVYPTELFPTEIRGTAMGIAVSISRIGAAVGTFLLPIGIAAIGVHSTTLITALMAGVGLLACILWAPETHGLSLSAASEAQTETSDVYTSNTSHIAH
ncbi:MFS transporter [Alcaligenes faecalis]|uniref:MFS transporter n=1 Tax=Alcaligenes faecalis TaxID=511 RepID=UPI000A2D2F94|nr:MFS transporter [Alcaligenes faecalis]OSZ45872.1 MFS transporter [Alcaligenes faecalis]OSZ52804.1 MFS transporter [Alcaligenes faecalis]OSZ54833.1 MFS transporter [Alcaligenes faecalis]